MDKIRYYQPRDQATDEDSDGDIDLAGLTYSLEIVQQPQRARMCGFGDKDRRNITPAPVLKLVAKTSEGKIVQASRLSRQAFVVNADLWLEDEVTERNLVLISSISSAKPPQRPCPSRPIDSTSSRGSRSSKTPGGNKSGSTSPTLTPDGHSTLIVPDKLSPSERPKQAVRFQDGHYDPSSDHHWNESRDTLKHEETRVHQRTDSARSATNPDDVYNMNTEQAVDEEMDELQGGSTEEDVDWESLSTQNLVGQTTVAGQVAPDLDGKSSHIWFAFSVLSIRTEGIFKLRFSLIDLTQMEGKTASVIYMLFSNPIHVQSPKKFLGTCDNNKIANHLNKYSIRIPSRKDEKPYRG
ncbi:velvet factor [Gamsiella multidivaricata]|uniref:velvet factor n=1 Tax=Gamsiella multidivaricata TaxID=101098 RepID=UPI00221FBD91|nr:velvet factor [Gamsiella multidivaricata]KAI7817700.1 velvet factor [Gamsiella multidivaricata]